MSDQDLFLELKGVTKDYAGGAASNTVLQGVDFRLSQGEAVAVVGPSGCGKSTLLNLAGTLDAPTSGEVLIGGKDVLRLSPGEIARLRNREIGFVFQFHHLLPQCNVLENVLVPAMVNPQAEGARGRGEKLLDRVGLSARLGHLPGQLSGGEKQRVAVVRALINRPRLLLADEPTGSLNREGADSLTHLLLELKEDERLALLVVTHSMAVAESMDRVLELREGRLLTKG